MIKKFQEKDFIDFLRIDKDSFPNPLSKDKFFKIIKKYFCLGFWGKGQFIGYVIFERKRRYILIRRIAVLKKYRSCGVGSKLYKWVEEFSTGSKITLCVRESNIPAQNFYQKHEFVKSKNINNYYKNGENAIVFQKKLNQGGRKA